MPFPSSPIIFEVWGKVSLMFYIRENWNNSELFFLILAVWFNKCISACLFIGDSVTLTQKHIHAGVFLISFAGFALKPCVLLGWDLLCYSMFFSDFGLGRTYKLSWANEPHLVPALGVQNHGFVLLQLCRSVSRKEQRPVLGTASAHVQQEVQGLGLKGRQGSR